MCEDDPLKIDPGLCGCGVTDVDSDGDGLPNCLDECPLNPLRSKLGPCACKEVTKEGCDDLYYPYIDCEGDAILTMKVSTGRRDSISQVSIHLYEHAGREYGVNNCELKNSDIKSSKYGRHRVDIGLEYSVLGKYFELECQVSAQNGPVRHQVRKWTSDCDAAFADFYWQCAAEEEVAESRSSVKLSGLWYVAALIL
jgi:hypothetical protein